MVVSEAQLLQMLYALLLPMFRIAAMLMSMTVFGTRLLPNNIRILLALMMSIVIYEKVPVNITYDPLSIDLYIVIAQEIIIGVAMGFCMQLVFQAFVIGGQLVAMQGGLGFASMMDPQNAVSVPAVSQFYLMLVTLLFLSFDGHLVMFEMLIKSFTILPIDKSGLGMNSLWLLVQSSAWMFSTAVAMALPALVVLLCLNIAFGVMTKASPQLNIFTVGFPITITCCVLFMLVSLPVVAELFVQLYERGVDLAWLLVSSR